MMEVFGRIWETLAGTRPGCRAPWGGVIVGTLRLTLLLVFALAGLAVFEAVSPAEAQAPVAVTVAFEASTYTVAESDDSSTTDVTENAVEVKVTLSADPLREVIIPITRTNQGRGHQLRLFGCADQRHLRQRRHGENLYLHRNPGHC